VQGNLEIYRKLLQKFRHNYSEFETLFREALLDDDQEAPMRCAHTLKGVADNIGAHTVSEKAKALESACREYQTAQHISQLLQDVTEELSFVIEGLALTLEHSPSTLPLDSLEDSRIPPATYECITKLKILIDESDIRALQAIDELRMMRGMKSYSRIMDGVSSALNSFDFDTALKLMNEVNVTQDVHIQAPSLITSK